MAAFAFAPWLREALQDRKLLKGGLELGVWSAIGYQTQSVGLITSEASRASFLSTFTVRSEPHCPCCPGRPTALPGAASLPGACTP